MATAKKLSIIICLGNKFRSASSSSSLKFTITVIPLSSIVVLESMGLGENFHKDPADQLIAATARTENLRLITCDKRIKDSGVVVTA